MTLAEARDVLTDMRKEYIKRHQQIVAGSTGSAVSTTIAASAGATV